MRYTNRVESELAIKRLAECIQRTKERLETLRRNIPYLEVQQWQSQNQQPNQQPPLQP